MKLGRALRGRVSPETLAPALAATDVAGLDYDSRRVDAGFPVLRLSRRAYRRPTVRARGPGPWRCRHRQRIGAEEEALASRWVQVRTAARLWRWPRGISTATPMSAWDSPASPAPTVRPPPPISSIRYCAPPAYHGDDRHDRVSPGRAGAAGHQYHPRIARSGAPVRTTGEGWGTHATMEVSSHALALGRVFGLHFHTAVFTNLTRDHLDFHGNMEAYFAAKAELFSGAGAPPPPFAVVNRDDEYGRPMTFHRDAGSGTGWGRTRTCARAIYRPLCGVAFRCPVRQGAFRGATRRCSAPSTSTIFWRRAARRSPTASRRRRSAGIAALQAVPGTLRARGRRPAVVVAVDYAHTDDALRNTIAVARGLNPRRVITLFGCGGDRDRTKRPLMGQAAAEASDFVVLDQRQSALGGSAGDHE